MSRALFLSIPVALVLCAAVPAHAVPDDDQLTGQLAGPSRAVTDEIVDSVASEIERAAVMLNIPGEPKPYFINHKLTEVEVNDVVSSLGSTTSKSDRHFVLLEARVHVGNYQRDNSNFVVANSPGTDGVSTIQLPIEATPRIARRAAWLVTDAAYKEALEQLRAKIDTRRAGGGMANNVDRPSYTRQPAHVQEEPVLVPRLAKPDALEQRAQAISKVFRGMPHVRDSRVAFTSFLERRWYINNEGTRAHDTRRVSGVVIVATGQAEDGQELALYYSRYGLTEDDLPGDAELIREAKKLSTDLAALRTAPVMDHYIGPVLFEGMGAAGIVRNTLAPHLGGTPLPEGLPANEARQFGGALADRVGLRVLSPLLSLVDDPTARQAGKRALIGGYRFDDEGVPAQRVEVAKDGTLTALLGSRTPAGAGADHVSNGHARRSAPGGVFHGSATNLFVSGKRGKSRPQLVRALLAEAKAQGLPYALIIRDFDDAAATAAPELSTRELLHLFQTVDRQAPPMAMMAYKIYPNGKEELVRGVQLRPVPVRAWRDVMAVGKNTTVFNYLASTEHYLVHKINGASEGGAVPSSGVESAVITPDLLFKELEVVGSTTGRRPLPLVTPPTK